MIDVLPESMGKILVLKAAGTLTDQDYKDVFIPRPESIMHEQGKARLLCMRDATKRTRPILPGVPSGTYLKERQ
jgi:hypothetical protein